MRMKIEVDMDDLAESFLMDCERSQVVEFVMAVDRIHADCQFTEDLILGLIRSLCSDYGPVDFQELLDAIKRAAEGAPQP